MLEGIDPAISPELLKVLCEMGHGDEIMFADAHYPANGKNKRVIRADGVDNKTLLAAIAPLFPLDQYEQAVTMSNPIKNDKLDPAVEKCVREALHYKGKITRVSLNALYRHSTSVYAIVQTGETAQYANIILRKGVVNLEKVRYRPGKKGKKA